MTAWSITYMWNQKKSRTHRNSRMVATGAGVLLKRKYRELGKWAQTFSYEMSKV